MPALLHRTSGPPGGMAGDMPRSRSASTSAAAAAPPPPPPQRSDSGATTATAATNATTTATARLDLSAGSDLRHPIPLETAELLREARRFAELPSSRRGQQFPSSRAASSSPQAAASQPLQIDELVLRGRSIDTGNVRALAEVVARGRGRLKRLDLSFCRCGSDIAGSVVSCTEEEAPHALPTPHASPDPGDGHPLQPVKSTLRSIDLSFCRIGVTAMPVIARSLSSVVSRLRSLSLRYNPITAQGLGLLLKWGLNLTHIDCRCCGILSHAEGRETGLAFILEGVRENTVCSRMELEGNGFTGVEQQRVYEEVAHNKRSAFQPGGVTFADPKADEVLRSECPNLNRYLAWGDAHNVEVALSSYLTPDGEVSAWSGGDFQFNPALESAVVSEVMAVEALLMRKRVPQIAPPSSQVLALRAEGGAAAPHRGGGGAVRRRDGGGDHNSDEVSRPLSAWVGSGTITAATATTTTTTTTAAGGGAAVTVSVPPPPRVGAGARRAGSGGGGGGGGEEIVAAAAASAASHRQASLRRGGTPLQQPAQPQEEVSGVASSGGGGNDQSGFSFGSSILPPPSPDSATPVPAVQVHHHQRAGREKGIRGATPYEEPQQQQQQQQNHTQRGIYPPPPQQHGGSRSANTTFGAESGGGTPASSGFRSSASPVHPVVPEPRAAALREGVLAGQIGGSGGVGHAFHPQGHPYPQQQQPQQHSFSTSRTATTSYGEESVIHSGSGPAADVPLPRAFEPSPYTPRSSRQQRVGYLGEGGGGGGGGGASRRRDRVTPALLNACMSGDDACRAIIGEHLFAALPAEMGKLQGAPAQLIPCCGIPDVLNHLRLGSDERITGIAKLLHLLLVAPCDLHAGREEEILSEASNIVAAKASAIHQSASRRDDYDAKRRDENCKARSLLRVLRKRQSDKSYDPAAEDAALDDLPLLRPEGKGATSRAEAPQRAKRSLSAPRGVERRSRSTPRKARHASVSVQESRLERPERRSASRSRRMTSTPVRGTPQAKRAASQPHTRKAVPARRVPEESFQIETPIYQQSASYKPPRVTRFVPQAHISSHSVI